MRKINIEVDIDLENPSCQEVERTYDYYGYKVHENKYMLNLSSYDFDKDRLKDGKENVSECVYAMSDNRNELLKISFAEFVNLGRPRSIKISTKTLVERVK